MRSSRMFLAKHDMQSLLRTLGRCSLFIYIGDESSWSDESGIQASTRSKYHLSCPLGWVVKGIYLNFNYRSNEKQTIRSCRQHISWSNQHVISPLYIAKYHKNDTYNTWWYLSIPKHSQASKFFQPTTNDHGPRVSPTRTRRHDLHGWMPCRWIPQRILGV